MEYRKQRILTERAREEEHKPASSRKTGEAAVKPLSQRFPYDNTGKGGQLLSLQNGPGNSFVQKVVAGLRAHDGERTEEDTLEQTVSDLHERRGSGHTLDVDTREEMEGAFGQDLGDVRLHTDQSANEAADRLNAKAFTMGTDIFFSKEGSGEVSSSVGKELLAHELTHVVQQGTGQIDLPGNSVKMGEPGDAYEAQADSMAQAVTSGDSIQCKTAEEEEEEEKRREEGEYLQARPADAIVQRDELDADKEAQLAERRAGWDKVLGLALLADQRTRKRPPNWPLLQETWANLESETSAYAAAYPEASNYSSAVFAFTMQANGVAVGAQLSDEDAAAALAGMSFYELCSGYAPSLPGDSKAPAENSSATSGGVGPHSR